MRSSGQRHLNIRAYEAKRVEVTKCVRLRGCGFSITGRVHRRRQHMIVLSRWTSGAQNMTGRG